MTNPFPLIYADMRKTRVGVFTVLLLIAIAVAVGIAISTQERALQKGTSFATKPFDLIIGASKNRVQLLLSTVYLQNAAVEHIDGKLLEELQDKEGIKMITPIVQKGSFQKYRLIGVTPDFIKESRKNAISEGRNFQAINEAIVGHDVKLKMNEKFFPALKGLNKTKNRLRNKMSYTVVGRLPKWHSPWDNAILVPVESIWLLENLPMGHKKNQEIVRRIDDPFNEGLGHIRTATTTENKSPKPFDFKAFKIGPPWDSQYLPSIPAIIVNFSRAKEGYLMRSEFKKRENVTAFFPQEVLEELHSLMGNVKGMLTIVAFSIQGLVIASVLLTIFASLSSKQSQFGVLRALGADRTFIFSLIWSHLTILIIIGSLLGLGLGWIVAKILTSHIETQTGLSLPAVLSIKELKMVITLIVSGSILSVIPSIGIYRKNVSTLLRANV